MSLIKAMVLFDSCSSFPPSPSDAHRCQENHTEDEIMTQWSHAGCDIISFQQPGKGNVIFSSGRNLTSDRAKCSPDFLLSCWSARQEVPSQLCQGIQTRSWSLINSLRAAEPSHISFYPQVSGIHMCPRSETYTVREGENYKVFTFQYLYFSLTPQTRKGCLLSSQKGGDFNLLNLLLNIKRIWLVNSLLKNTFPSFLFWSAFGHFLSSAHGWLPGLIFWTEYISLHYQHMWQITNLTHQNALECNVPVTEGHLKFSNLSSYSDCQR